MGCGWRASSQLKIDNHIASMHSTPRVNVEVPITSPQDQAPEEQPWVDYYLPPTSEDGFSLPEISFSDVQSVAGSLPAAAGAPPQRGRPVFGRHRRRFQQHQFKRLFHPGDRCLPPNATICWKGIVDQWSTEQGLRSRSWGTVNFCHFC